MEWKWSICDMIWMGLVLFALGLSWHSLTSLEMKKPTKIICEVIAIVIILLFPFGRKWEVNNLINDNGYKLIAKTGWVSYSEVAPEKYLNKPCLWGYFEINHENKLVYYNRSFYSESPPRMEHIRLK